MNTIDKIAVIAMSGRFPAADSVSELWDNLLKPADSFTSYTKDDYRALHVPDSLINNDCFIARVPRLNDATGYDLAALAITTEQAHTIPAQARLMLQCCNELLDESGYYPDEFQGLMGFWGGQGFDNYALKCVQAQYGSLAGFPELTNTHTHSLAPTIAKYLNLKGPVIQLQTACSTSLVAVHQAAMALATYQCDIAIAGGVSIQYAFLPGYLYQEGEIFSRDGICRPFDAAANGTVFGEGCGVVMLRRLQDAIADGDNILGIISGSAVTNDGAARAGFTAPGVTGQIATLETAYSEANSSPENLVYLETHGTGTPVGDPLELSALTQFIRKYSDKKAFCELGAIKGTIGHLDAAAGVTGLIKCLLVIKHNQIPVIHNFTDPNPQIDWANSPFLISKQPSPLQLTRDNLLGVSSFGLGGTNAHVVLHCV